MSIKKLTATAIGVIALLGHASSFAQAADTAATIKSVTDALGIDLFGYTRGGAYGATNGMPKGGYSLGGDLQKYRLGNEGDNYIEVGITKRFALANGVKFGATWMPSVYQGNTGTAQAYAEMSGLAFAPGVSFWGGQRYHRISDIHIVDNWFMEDGDNYGAGVDGIDVAGGKLNVAVHTDGSTGAKVTSTAANGKRVNIQLRNIPTNPGGALTLTAGAVRGAFGNGTDGFALGAMHVQSDFLVKGLTNKAIIQTSSGHADIRGKFYNETGVGAKQLRLLDTIDWQVGLLGGQALIGYQTSTPDNGVKTTDTSIGGRVSYGVMPNVKLLGDLGITNRATSGQASQNLTKATVAVALSPDTNFWTRPEFRVYATQANWNSAAAAANVTSFGAGGHTSGTTLGVQMEAWW